MKTETITCSSKNFYCKHKTGWFKVIRIKKWWFEVSAKYFLCLDCEDLIPIAEYEKTQSELINNLKQIK